MLGRSIGNYRLVSKIGEGGMGTVYLAQHTTLDRRAAVKVLLPELSSSQDIVSRFFNEARAATAVRHPGIVEVFDFGILDDEFAYIVMEYLDGESLAARMLRGRSTPAVTLTIVRAIARALQAAHGQGIVHRDLSPDNVFLVPDAELPSGERVKLLDFGIAKLASGIGDASNTTTGTIMGTPAYMSPEQCRGAGLVDHRADLYALGCVAYEMLCGQPPFVADGPGDVLARHIYFRPALLRSHRLSIPAELDDLVLWLLEKDPEDRPATATDLLQAVDHLVAVTPPAVTLSEPGTNSVIVTPPMIRETTLRGAASASAVPIRETSGPRLGVVAGAVTVALTLLLVILFARGAHDGATSSNTAPVTAAGEPKQPAPAAPPAALALAAARPPLVAPKPVEAGSPAPTATSARAARPGDVARPTATATSNSAARPSDAPAKPVTAAQPGPVVRPSEATADASKPISSPSQVDSARPADAELPAATTSADAAKSMAAATAPAAAAPAGTPSATAAANPPDAACTRAAFAAVLEAEAPGKPEVHEALERLERCKATMKDELYKDIHDQLAAKS